MERNTVLAIVLMSLVMLVFYVMQGVFFPPPQPDVIGNSETTVTAVEIQETPETPPEVIVLPPPTVQETSPASQQTVLDSGPQVLERIRIETELAEVILTNAGGDMVSWRLKEHFDKGEGVDMILSGDKEARTFSLAFGGLGAEPVSSLFYVNRISQYSVEFFRDFAVPGSDGTFRLTKRYDFKPSDYMFELTVTLDGGYSVSNFNFDGNAYTLSFGPQIGPRFEKLNIYYDYRDYVAFINGKRKKVKANEIIESRPAWAAITGKYFAFIAVPYLAQYSLSFSEAPEAGLSLASRFNIVRPPVNVSKTADTYRFYLGPKTQDALVGYNTGKNEFGIKDTNLVEVASSRGVLAPLERFLKWMLSIFYRVIPNYGIAIIMLTLFVKICFFPLTKKGSEATLRMQALAPKIKELQEKYKGNQQKLNAEMGEFYKKEGYNPISGCLPLLLQIPIFIAMYQLFNNHFDIRGAGFIPGWIPDLSVPEAIWNFPDGFRLPLLGWTAFRGLPFIYVASQLLYGKVTQMPGQQSNAQMKMMLYIMPIVFFFVLYDVPSGLLVYWIFSNLLTLVQQLIINKYIMAKKAAQAAVQASEPQTVIAPDKNAAKKNVIAPKNNVNTHKKKKKK